MMGDVISPKHIPLPTFFFFFLAGCAVAPTQQTAERAPSATAERENSRESQNDGGEGNGGRRHRHHNRRHGRGGDANGPANPQIANVAGNFDFYLLSLSWSPGFCATPAGQNDPGQCAPGRKFSFVLHGLWPQYEQTGWPEDCSTEQMDPSLARKMINIMPSEKLIQHEWQKHGTCSGLSSKDYFEEADEAFHSINIPAPYRELASMLTVSPTEIRSQFAAANPKIGEQGFVVECSGNGHYLSEVHACLNKDLEGRACNREEQRHECRSDSVVMRPVR